MVPVVQSLVTKTLNAGVQGHPRAKQNIQSDRICCVLVELGCAKCSSFLQGEPTCLLSLSFWKSFAFFKKEHLCMLLSLLP